MNWEELTGDAFPDAVRKSQRVCVVPLACVERHAHHLPINTDVLIAREACRRAAMLEPFVIFPDVLFTQILEARHCPGTIAIDADLMLRLLDNICREIARKCLRDAGLSTAIAWYADHPTHYCGQAIHGTAEKGDRLLDAYARYLAEAVRAARRDDVARELQDEFFRSDPGRRDA